MKTIRLLPLALLMGLTAVSAGAGERGRHSSGSFSSDRSQQSRPAATTSHGSSMNRPGNNNNGSQGGFRPGNNNNGSQGGFRPGNNNNGSQGGFRPGNNNNGSQGGFRPGNNNSHERPGATTPATRPGATTPGNNRPGNNRPGSGSTTITRPGTTVPAGGGANYRPGTPNVRPTTPPPPPPSAGHRPNYPNRPGNSYRPGWSYRPERPHTPPSFGYYRPTPPPHWRPVGRVPNISTILGVTLGTLLSNSVNYFYNNGFNVAGYTSNEVYLNNVNYANVMWPNATMYYRNGYLQGSLFSAATPGYDPTRYNYVYNYLSSQYGAPVSTSNLASGGMTCTWWGNGGSYITLSFYPETVYGAGTRYFTTLSTGN